MRNEIMCLMVSGPQIDDGLRTALYLAACELIRSGKKSAKFSDENGEGKVFTRHRRGFVNSFMTGVVFDATIERNDGIITSRFLVDDTRIPTEEEVLEGSWLPVPDFLIGE